MVNIEWLKRNFELSVVKRVVKLDNHNNQSVDNNVNTEDRRSVSGWLADSEWLVR